MAHITILPSQVDTTYIMEFVISEAETESQSLNVSDVNLKAEYFLDEELTIKIGESSPPNTPFVYDNITSGDLIIYCKIVGDVDEVVDSLEVEVLDWKPRFDFVNYSCVPINEPINLRLSYLFLNDLGVCSDNLDPQVQWKVFLGEEQIGNTTTIDIEDVDNISLEDLQKTITFTSIGQYIISCVVQNCNIAIEKVFTLDVCSPLKLRRLSCGKYGIYNSSTEFVQEFTIRNLEDEIVEAGKVGTLSYYEVNLSDGIYKITLPNYEHYIINYCEVDNCYISLLKKTLCKKCCEKITAEEMRIIPIYSVYRKLVDQDEKYEILYTNEDKENRISALYSIKELGEKLLSYCNTCKTKCNCGC